MILTDYDAAGNMYSLASGVNRYTSHNCTMVKLRVHQTAKFPSMIVFTEGNADEVRQLVYSSDAVVLKEYWWVTEKLGLDMNKLKGKPVVALMGGGGFRFIMHREPNLKFFKEHSMRLATSSIDFLQHQRMAWIPPCTRYEEIREKYDHTKTEPPLIYASPSRDTDIRLHLQLQFNMIMHQLRKEGLRFQAVCASNAQKMISNDQNLRQKARASIFFDRIYDIYGVNSQEAASFEAAVVTGSNGFVINSLRRFGFRCPFIIVRTYEEAKNAVRKLLQNQDYRAMKAEQCREYAEQLHSGRESAKRLIALLES